MGIVKQILILLSLLTIKGSFISHQHSNNLMMPVDKHNVADKLFNRDLVNKFYKLNQNDLFWFTSRPETALLRESFKDILDSSANIGLLKEKYHYDQIAKNYDAAFGDNDSAKLDNDQLFTDAAIMYCKDILQGFDISHWINADAISPKYTSAENENIISKLNSVRTAIQLKEFVKSLEPDAVEYNDMKNALHEASQNRDSGSCKLLTVSMNLFRWIHHFHLNKYVVVNISSAVLKYYESDSLKLQMKVVVGKPSTRTPRFAAYCNQVILYPYWNVPRKIVVNELLPDFKKNPANVELMNMQVIDEYGIIVDPGKIKWDTYNKNNFPYRIRQSTGCDNALGVLKFNLTSPFDVYMHDTNFKIAFKSAWRYYSHGCIRIEKPLALANFILDTPIDSSFLQSCLKDELPTIIDIKEPIPVFVIYSPAEIASTGKLVFYKDVYHLMNKR